MKIYVFYAEQLNGFHLFYLRMLEKILKNELVVSKNLKILSNNNLLMVNSKIFKPPMIVSKVKSSFTMLNLHQIEVKFTTLFFYLVVDYY